MSSVSKKVTSRLLASVPKFQKVIEIAKDRDLNESDTVAILNDILSEVFGYDKYLEVTSELMIRGTYCDLAIKIDDKFQFIIEAKAIGLDLKEAHVKQAIDYGANLGVQWIVLTNGLEWRLYRIRFEKPINFDLVCSFSFTELNPKSDKDQELLYIFCKEGLNNNARENFYEIVQNVNRYTIGQLLLGDPVLGLIRRELKKLAPGIRVEENEIAAILIEKVIKREILEGESSDRAFQKISKFYKKQAKSKPSKKKPSSTSENQQESISLSDQLLNESNNSTNE